MGVGVRVGVEGGGWRVEGLWEGEEEGREDLWTPIERVGKAESPRGKGGK